MHQSKAIEAGVSMKKKITSTTLAALILVTICALQVA
jgi:hypothetical protein